MGEREQNFRISPGATLEWYKNGWFTFYTEFGITFERNAIRTTSNDGLSDTDPRILVRPNLTLIGVTIGSKIYIAAETISLGPRGVSNIGLGYRF